MKRYLLLKNIKFYFLVSFLVLFLTHPISRDGIATYYGTFCPFFLLLWFAYIVGFEVFKLHLKSVFKNVLPFIVLILFCAFSLTYSKDINYGFAKLIGLMFYITPLIIISNYYYDEIFSKENLYLSYLIIILGIILVLILFYLYPIEYDVPSIKKTFLFWSHTGLGNYLGFAILVNFYLLKNVEFNKKLKIAFLITLFLLFLGLMMTAKRGVLYGVILVFALNFVFDRLNKKKRNNLYLKIFGIIIISFTLFYSFPNYFSTSITRFNTVQSFSTTEYNNEYSLGPRVRAIKTVKKEFSENPIAGIGLGGFNAVSESKTYMRYPHNLFLETAVELGLIGLLIMFYILIKGFKKLFLFNKDLFVVAIFYLWLSMTGGGLSDHKILYMLLFINIGKT